jgi:hypothetical protein
LSQEVSFMSAGWRRLNTRDRVIVGGAGVAFIAGFLPWWEAAGLGGWSRSGWSAGFTAWAGTLLLTTAGVLLVLRRTGASWPTTAVGASKLTKDWLLLRVRQFDSGEVFTATAEQQMSFACDTQVPHPLSVAARRDEVASAVQSQRVNRVASRLAAGTTLDFEDP